MLGRLGGIRRNERKAWKEMIEKEVRTFKIICMVLKRRALSLSKIINVF